MSIQKVSPKISNKFILGIIDPQNDFFSHGSFPVPNSNEIIGPINKLRFMTSDNINTFISLDTHPLNHVSFASTHNKNPYDKIKISVGTGESTIETEQILWPTHCVENTFGAQLNFNLITKSSDWKVKKGRMSNIESYSAFGDEFLNKFKNTGLNAKLKYDKYTDIILVGLATDYCVYYTALDALKYGFRVHIILSCVRGVDKNTTEQAINDLKLKGVVFYQDVIDFILYFENCMNPYPKSKLKIK